ncbi:hypothetical protein GF323_03860 [Candidatus Woesearchaeota archaeon]|nr:hypothetical protein [Candidatus Woesearchaeota archaeon]
MKFECKKCHYAMEKEKVPGRCPYCGGENTMGKASSAQDILEQVEKERKD